MNKLLTICERKIHLQICVLMHFTLWTYDST